MYKKLILVFYLFVIIIFQISLSVDINSAVSDFNKLNKTAKTSIIQLELYLLNYNVGSIDGIYGPNTKEAILRFQKHNFLNVDGKLTKKLESKLMSSIEEKNIKIKLKKPRKKKGFTSLGKNGVNLLVATSKAAMNRYQNEIENLVSVYKRVDTSKILRMNESNELISILPETKVLIIDVHYKYIVGKILNNDYKDKIVYIPWEYIKEDLTKLSYSERMSGSGWKEGTISEDTVGFSKFTSDIMADWIRGSSPVKPYANLDDNIYLNNGDRVQINLNSKKIHPDLSSNMLDIYFYRVKYKNNEYWVIDGALKVNGKLLW